MKILFFISFSFLLLYSSAQQPMDWSAFNQRVDARPYRGKKFTIQAAIKVKTIDSTAEGEIWVRIDREKKKMGFFYNMMDKPIRLNEWKIYNIGGTIDKDAEWIYFGGLYHRRGKFYFDDFKLFVEDQQHQMQEVNIGEGNFEGDSTAIAAHWSYMQKRLGITVNATSSDAFSGKQSFLADASGFKPLKTYGNNEDSGHYAAVNHIRLYYEVYGHGEPLLLLHGNSESIASFYKQIPELSKHYKVIALDSRGQGKSTEDGKRFTYELFAEDTKALLDHLQLDSVNVLGWSDGGNIGLIMAMKYPAKVKQLAVMGANLYNNSSSVKGAVNRYLRKELSQIKDTLNKSIFRKRMIELLLYEPNIKAEALEKITCPVLVMAGSNDVIKQKHTELIAGKIKHSKLVIFEKGNHYEPWEHPERFNKTVLDFLKPAE